LTKTASLRSHGISTEGWITCCEGMGQMTREWG
jgi:hypothetical protein